MKILHIDSSENLITSFSRKYTRKIVDKIIDSNNEENFKILRRDLVTNPLPCVTSEWAIQAAIINPEERTDKVALALSDALIDELFVSDYIVIGSPMHNYTISSYLKIYFDQIVRFGRTISSQHEGLIKHKKTFVVMTRGGSDYEKGEPYNHMNNHEFYLKMILEKIGLKPRFIVLNGLVKGEDYVKVACESADSQINSLDYNFIR